MDAPTLEELTEFTLKSYVKLLKYLNQIYKIVPFCKVNNKDTPYLILRHDIDISLPEALKMAQIEKDLNIQSTYFVLLSSSVYNILEGDNVNILKQISKLGHEIGLHYHPAQYRLYKQNPNKTLEIEIQLLEHLLGKKIYSIARHGPWQRDPFARIKKYISANHPYLIGDLYIHESGRAWTPLQGLINLLKKPTAFPKVQLLVHPENWQEDKIDRNTLLERHFQALAEKNLMLKKRALEYFQKDPLINNYDAMIKKVKQSDFTFQNLEIAKKQSKLRQKLASHTVLPRYYLIHTTIGWKVSNLRKAINYKLKQIRKQYLA
jgi:hypothetical protein